MGIKHRTADGAKARESGGDGNGGAPVASDGRGA